MKLLERLVKGKKYLVFIDLEGTQMTSEMIEIGAYVATLNRDGTIKKVDNGFSSYVKATTPIGKFVRDLTGIDEKTLRTKGIPFVEAMSQFRKYLGKYWGECNFITFGNNDLRIISQSYLHSPGADPEIEATINKHYIDYASFISQFMKDEKGNPMSLSHYLDAFKIDFQGKKHNASADAYNLMLLYKAFYEKIDIVAEYYKKAISRHPALPRPLKKVTSILSEGKGVSPEEWDELIRGTFE